ncbi:MAG: CotH kinase family protein [Bacteroidaceae bacterium]|nr:CotH kinase family protein [Bacteroidaceae bacterium]
MTDKYPVKQAPSGFLNNLNRNGRRRSLEKRWMATLVAILCLSSVCRADVTDLFINEIQVSNVDMYLSPVWNYDAWMEFYNPTDTIVNLFHCYVSDDPFVPKKNPITWQFDVPAHGFAVMWLGEHEDTAPLQIPLDADCDGGWYGIYDRYANLLLSVSYPKGVSRASWARITDGSDVWGYTAEPSPGASNDASAFASEMVSAPEPDLSSGLFASGIRTLTVPIPAGTTLRYTTDGSTPTATNGITANADDTGKASFDIAETTLLRFRLYADGMLPSRVVTRSFIKEANRTFTIPVVSVVTDPRHFYNDTIGVMVKGTNGVAGRGFLGPCNWNRDWDRPVNFAYTLPDGTTPIDREANLCICGGWSRPNDPHSFKLKANKVFYDENILCYPFFSAKPHIRNRTIQLRNGGNDFNCRLYDAAIQTIILSSGLDIDGQSCQPVIHYLNGKYKGVLNMREPNNKHYVFANYGLGSDEIDLFELTTSCYHQLCGTKDALVELRELAKLSADDAVYDDICQRLLDIDEFANYMATQIWLCPSDWLSNHNNMKGFRPRDDNGRYRFVLLDLDSSFDTSSPFDFFTHTNTISNATDHTFGEFDVPNIFYYLMDNARFRKRFTDSFCLISGSVFEPTRCHAIIDSMAATLRPMLAYENRSPNDSQTKLKKNFSADHQTRMITKLKAYWPLRLTDATSVRATLSANIPEARLSVNDLPVPTNRFDGTLFLPITLHAQAPEGYRFRGWRDLKGGEKRVLIPRGHAWSYYDQGTLANTGWKRRAYDDSSWPTGKAPLGFATTDKGIVTTLSYGSDNSVKRSTYYFRTWVTLSSAIASAQLSYRCDDGFVIYVNGTEAARVNMPNGTISYSTFASSTVTDWTEGTVSLNPALFTSGTNLIAVEVHNCSATSTDIYWDAALSVTLNDDSDSSLVSTDETYTLPLTGDYELVACYEPVEHDEGTCSVVINEVSASNSIFISDVFKRSDWVELYNTTSHPIDLAGWYISDDVDEPYKYCFPADEPLTLIAPHGFSLVWCDKQTGSSALHAPFRLSSDNSVIILTSPDKLFADTLAYIPHNGTESIGRYPDGGRNTWLFTRPTPEAPNTVTSRSSTYVESLINGTTNGMEASHEMKGATEPNLHDDALYDLFGRKVLAPHSGYIYIQRGRKILF